MNLLDQVKNWPRGAELLFDWLGSDGVVVSQETAQARANICLTCPQHDSGASVTGAMAGGFKRLLELKNKAGLRVSGEKNLGLCDICGCSTRVKIWQPIDRICKMKLPEEVYPSHCWITKNL